MLLSFILAAFIATTSESYEADRVRNLPNLNGPLNFTIFSGYLDATPGTHLHYIFVESENDPANDPVLLWLNGGPGCSSLLGFFTAQGPFRVNESQLTMNPYAWNKVANMIFLESPAGVGFSYSDDRNYSHNDDKTSENNFLAVKSWFAKFPQYKSNDFYLTGESYAGVYVPTLAVRLLDEPTINYKGFTLGNSLLDANLLGNSVIRFSYYHGLIDTTMWSKITASCCKSGDESPSNCDFATNTTTECSQAVSEAQLFVLASNINPYAIFEDCTSPSTGNVSNSNRNKSNLKKIGWSSIVNSLPQDIQFILNQDDGVFPCHDDSQIINYLGRADVRRALHIPRSVPEWLDCSPVVYFLYNKQYKALQSQVLKNIKAGKRVLLYAGDNDLVCDFIGNQWFSDSLGLPQIGKYKAWHANGQVAGFVKHYQGFDFATVRGAGHAVPDHKPAVALTMIKRFLNNETLS